RWIQWVYGTGGTTILDATVDGSNRSFPFRSPVEKTPQPVEGPVPPMNTSMEIFIPDYYAVGDYFEVTLRNWNQCNPYDDPSIPGPPADVINGDFPPVETTAMALIVALPDGSITAVGPFCDNITAQYLNAATPGGMWSGSGIIDEFTGLFHPGTAGPGTHLISYAVTDAKGCSATGTTNIEVLEIPSLSLTDGSPIYLCPGLNKQLEVNISGGATPYSYSWSGDTGPLSSTSVTKPIFETTTVGSYDLRFSVEDNEGCRRKLDINIAVEPLDITFIPPTLEVCQGSPLTLQPIVDGGSRNYILHEWSGTHSDKLSATDVEQPEFNTSETGTFNLRYRVTDNMSCSDEAEVTVVVKPQPTVSAGDDALLCTNTHTLTASTVPPLNGLWKQVSGPAPATFSSSTAPTTQVQVSDLGSYIFSWSVDLDDCRASDQVEVSFGSLPNPGIMAPQEICGLQATLEAYPDRTGGQWLVVDGPALASLGDSSSPLTEVEVAEPGAYTFRWTESAGPGCEGSAEVVLTFRPQARALVDPLPPQSCAPYTVNFNNQSQNAASYRWELGGGAGSTETNPEFTYENLSSDLLSHTIVLHAENQYGCNDSFSFPLNIAPRPLARASATPIDGCSPLEVAFSNNSLGATTYRWDFDDGSAAVSEAAPTHTFINTASFVAVHQVQLTTENDFGCSDQTTLPLTVYPGYQAGLSALPLSGCSPLEVSFEALPGAATYLWDFGDGRMSHETTPTHTYQAPGTYQVQLTATGPGGTSQSSEVQVRVYQNPTALFDVVPKIIYLPGERPVFINRSENASDYLWDMGDGSTYRDFAPNHTYTQPGLYTIGLTAISPEGCEDSYQMYEVLKVEVGGELAFPNAFTPDPSGPSGGRYEFGDPRNTVFYPSTQKGVSEYLLQIYTRWGELVFDGRMNTRAGDVTLIR
ncbi:MAG TPA: PKD domain-containing protein, partial [Bacteroidales bacterium]|nr:PKD domain-containing protein [Bacteroidales bacterium]